MTHKQVGAYEAVSTEFEARRQHDAAANLRIAGLKQLDVLKLCEQGGRLYLEDCPITVSTVLVIE